VNRLTTFARAAAKALARAFRWLFGAFCLTVTSARKQLDKNDVKAITTKLGAAIITMGSLKAGIASVVSEPETMWAVATTLFIVAGAFVEGVVRYHAAAEKPQDGPTPAEGKP
jgi:hypothetical protein